MDKKQHILTPSISIYVSWEKDKSSEDALDLTAFLLNEDGQISNISDMVFYGTTEVCDNKLISKEHKITIETKYNQVKKIACQSMSVSLKELPETVKHVVFVVSNNIQKPLDRFRNSSIKFRDGEEYSKSITFEDNGDDAFCVSVGAVEKMLNTWSLVIETTCYAGGIDKAYEDYVPKSIRDKYPINSFIRPTFRTKGPMPPSKGITENKSNKPKNNTWKRSPKEGLSISCKKQKCTDSTFGEEKTIKNKNNKTASMAKRYAERLKTSKK